MGASTVQPADDQELQEELSALTDGQLKHLAEVGKHDLYVMNKGILGYPDVNPQTHKALCLFIQNDEPEKKRRLSLMPRVHLKTSVITVGNNIRKAVKEPNRFQGLIVGETDTKAVDILREIKGHVERGATFRLLYPELIPEKLSGPGTDWSQNRASLKREAVLKHATWTALGKGGASVGGHWTHITPDDLIGLEALESPAEMLMAKNFVDNIESLTHSPMVDIIDFVGTRWSRTDVYAYIMRLFEGNILIFRREAIENGEPIFPQKHSLFTLGEIQKKPSVWFAQYCNNPIAQGQTDFPQGAVRPFTFTNDGGIAAVKDGVALRYKLEQLDIVMACDPNSGSVTAEDDAAIIVSATDSEDNIFVLQTWSGKTTPSGFVDKIFELYKRWHPRAVGIEQAGQQTSLHYFEKKSKEEQVYPYIVTLKPKNRVKPDRIRKAMQPILASRRLFLLTSQTTLRSQIEFFPDNDLIDELDALSYGTEEGMWRTADSYEEQEERGHALKLLSNRRSKLTGY